MFFISPPFGNYYNSNNSNYISIKGSFTLNCRPGLIQQIIKTLHYSFSHSGWINKIGLRNPGLPYAIQKYYVKDENKSIISIAILDKNEIPHILNLLPNDTNIEINVSCPNAETNMIQNGLQPFINNKRKWCIIKLSPTCDTKLIDSYYQQGFRQFHCSNTLPTKNGGLSGPSLIPYSSKLVKYISQNYDDATIIAGGGIQTKNDIEYYKKLGAHHFSISTLLFNPYKSFLFFFK